MKSTVFVITLSLVVLVLSAAGTLRAEPRYVGTEGCKCHKQEIRDWERSKHARAFDLLESGKKSSKKEKAGLDGGKDFTSEKRCLQCHTTGYDKNGGYEDSSTSGLAGVGCEMCHGPGSEYRELHKEKTTEFTREEAKGMGQVYGSENPDVCMTCHEHKDNPFTPKLDDRYKLDMEDALKDARAFHRLYPQEGKH